MSLDFRTPIGSSRGKGRRESGREREREERESVGEEGGRESVCERERDSMMVKGKAVFSRNCVQMDG